MDVYAEAVRRGGTLISVKVADDHLAAAEAALGNTATVDVVARGNYYRSAGWTGFDEHADSYTDAQIMRERANVL